MQWENQMPSQITTTSPAVKVENSLFRHLVHQETRTCQTPPRSEEPLHHPAKYSSHWTETQHIQMQTDSPVAVDNSRSDESYGPVPTERENTLPQPPPCRSRAPWLDYDEAYERRRRPPPHFCGTINLLRDRVLALEEVERTNRFSRPTATATAWRAGSGLTDDEFKVAMAKLKKQAYAPSSSPQKHTIFSRVVSGIFQTKATRAETPSNAEDEKACAVCLETFRRQEKVVVTPCSHIFHQTCIAPWVKEHGNCPVCRFVLCNRGKVVEDAGAGWVYYKDHGVGLQLE